MIIKALKEVSTGVLKSGIGVLCIIEGVLILKSGIRDFLK